MSHSFIKRIPFLPESWNEILNNDGQYFNNIFFNICLFTQKFFKILSATPNNMPVKFDWKHMIDLNRPSVYHPYIIQNFILVYVKYKKLNVLKYRYI